jgi:HSP20 family protein
MGNFFKKLMGSKKDENEEEVEEVVEYEDGEESQIDADQDKNSEEKWLDGEYDEGQLSVDVYQTSTQLIVKSTIAGVKPEDIDISINNDMLTIRGKREMKEKIKEEDYLYRECYWGGFSRSIILPVEVEVDKIDASLENGVLVIVLPKAKVAKQISIKVKEK